MRKRHWKQFVITMVGVIGSGKTYVARRLAKRLGAILLRTDDIRARLARRGKPIAEAITISNRLREQALLRGQSIILDFDAVRAEKRQELKALARKHHARIFFIQVNASEVVILKRLAAYRYPMPGVFHSHRQALLAYYHRRRFHRRRLRATPLFVIDNAHPVAPQIERVVKKLKG